VDAFEMAFWAFVAIGDGCWEWQGNRMPEWNYGRFCRGNRVMLAHRVSWEMANNRRPGALCVLHHCDNPPCVRPTHLFLGTRTDNAMDKVAKGRQARGDRANPRRGEEHPQHVLRVDDVRQIRELHARGGLTHGQLAERFGCSKGNVGFIVRGETWQ
jgi:hypothetical protein